MAPRMPYESAYTTGAKPQAAAHAHARGGRQMIATRTPQRHGSLHSLHSHMAAGAQAAAQATAQAAAERRNVKKVPLWCMLLLIIVLCILTRVLDLSKA